MKLRQCRDGRGDDVSLVTGVTFPENGLTQQHFRDEVDVNTIVRRFGVSGVVPVARELAEYGDFSEVGSFHDAMNAVTSGREAFARLPANLREQFDNDPAVFWEALQDPANDEEFVKLGVLKALEKAPEKQSAPEEKAP